MPLLLRRGTNAERLTITPQNGELIYVTDTKQLFVGDGTTLGGNGVTSSFSGTVLNDNLNVNGNEINGPGTINLIGTIQSQEGFLGDIQGGVIANDSAYIINSANKEGYFNKVLSTNGFYGDLTGSVFASDSTLIIDGNSGVINASVISSPGNNIEIYNETSGISNNVTIKTIDEGSSLTFTRSSADDRSNDPDIYGTILFSRDDINGGFTTSIISGGNLGLYLNNDSDGVFGASTSVSIINGNVGIGNNNPTTKLDVSGNVNVTGTIFATNLVGLVYGSMVGSVQGSVFATDSSLIIDGNNSQGTFTDLSTITVTTSDLTAQSIITGDLSVQSIIVPNDYVSISSNTPSQSTFLDVISNDERSILRLRRTSDNDLSIGSSLLGSIFFERTDPTNDNVVVGVIVGDNTGGISLYSDPTGSTYPESNTLTLKGNKVGIGTLTPTEVLDVRGSAVFSGEVRAMSVNGMIIADDSSVIVDPVTNAVTADTITANELLTLTARSTAPVTPALGMIALADRTTWDPLSVGSGNPYLVLYNGSAWVALA